MHMAAAVYARLSQNRSEDINKPQRQKDACAKWLEARGVQSWEPYEDGDTSALYGKSAVTGNA